MAKGNRKSFEDRRKDVVEAIFEGFASNKEVAERIGVTTGQFSRIRANMGFDFFEYCGGKSRKSDLRTKGKSIKLDTIKAEIAKGGDSIIRIHRSSGLNYSSVSNLARGNSLILKKSTMTRKKLDRIINEGLTLQDASVKYGYDPVNLSTILRKYGFPELVSEQLEPTRENIAILRNRENPKYRNFFSFVRRGLSLTELGGNFDFTAEFSRRLINNYGYHKVWRKSRENFKNHPVNNELLRGRNEINNYLRANLNNRLGSENVSWTERKLVQYTFNRVRIKGPGLIPIDKVSIILERYHQAKINGRKLTYKEAGKDTGLLEPDTRRILNSLDCPSLNWTAIYRPRLTEKQREAHCKAGEIEMSIADIAYFSERSEGLCARHIENSSNRMRTIKHFGHKEPNLTHRLASQIYEARDLGFSNGEIQDLFKVPANLVNYAFEDMGKIVKPIFQVLRLFNPDKDITKPYFS